MEITLSTPALLFPAVSLLMLAYTNRFVVLAKLIRDLHAQYKAEPDAKILGQMKNVLWRLGLIKNMQASGVLSILFCVICMFLLFAGYIFIGKVVFGASLVLLMISLILSVLEIQASIHALNLQVSDLERELRR
jgi:hypothetical protein